MLFRGVMTMDCLIAVVSARTATVLVHRDRDLGLLAECLPDLRASSPLTIDPA